MQSQRLFISMVIFISACNSVSNAPEIPKPESFHPSSIYLYRKGGLIRAADPTSIYLNQNYVASLTGNTYLKIDVDPKEYVIALYSKEDVDTEILVKANEEYCYEVQRNEKQVLLGAILGGIGTAMQKAFKLVEQDCNDWLPSISKYKFIDVQYGEN